MIALDTNILVYAHRQDSPHHKAAFEALQIATSRHRQCAIPWPCIHEFLAITTHPRIFNPPSTPADAHLAVTQLIHQHNVALIGEPKDHFDLLFDLLKDKFKGPRVHDARIAAICIGHGVSELWSADRDFERFPALRTFNPLR
jgi:toxin-antitoxin system PIN domain toxin